MESPERLLFAIPKKGRLNQATLDLLSGSDIKFHRHNRLDIALVQNFPIKLIFLPAADIPTFVYQGRVHLGITGWDQVQEHDAVLPKAARTKWEDVLDLEFGRCKLQVQVPEDGGIHEPKDLIGKRVATSFTNLASAYFEEIEGREGQEDLTNVHGTKQHEFRTSTEIITISGSVETSCALGLSEGIVDLVESGETMRAAGLKPIHTVVQSTAILIRNKSKAFSPAHAELADLVTSRIEGVVNAKRFVLCQYNIARSLLQEASEITPGRRAPTINALESAPDWVAVSSMVKKDEIATKMDLLTKLGAQDILVLNIVNTRISKKI